MEILARKLQTIPILLVFMYISVYNFIETDFYADYYETLKNIDNTLVLISLLAFLYKGYERWNLESLRCFSAVIVLNILSEFSHMLGERDYYRCYLLILYIFIASFILTSIYNNDKNG